jgi:hypothetical protein
MMLDAFVCFTSNYYSNYSWLSTKQFVCVSHHSQFSQYYDMFKFKIKQKLYPFSYVIQYSKLLQSTNVNKK